MENTLYDNSNDMLKRKKDSLTLDFSSGSKKARVQDLREGLLSSPDVGLLKLATPELERFIIHHQNGTLVSTPSQILFPKSVTEEQEAYARGFVDALVELHMKQSPLTAPGGIVCVDGQGSSFVTLTPMAVPHLQANIDALNALKRPQLLSSPIFSRPATIDLSSSLRLLSTVPQFTLPAPGQPSLPPKISVGSVPVEQTSQQLLKGTEQRSSSKVSIKDTVPKTVPNLSSTPPISPIDMSNQERIKVERKREKNRNAAQKCRTKKLERISRLEDRVRELKTQNASLAATANTQRDHANRLRQQIVDHVNNGCQIMVVREQSSS